MPGFTPQQGHYMAPGNPNSSQSLHPEGHFVYSPFYGMQSMAHALPGVIGQAHGIAPLPTSNNQLQLSVPHKRFASAGSHWPRRSSLHQLLEHDSENREIAQAANCEKSFDTVALPTEMPIGSQVHNRMPPQWGVVKIANVSQSLHMSLSMTVLFIVVMSTGLRLTSKEDSLLSHPAGNHSIPGSPGTPYHSTTGLCNPYYNGTFHC